MIGSPGRASDRRPLVEVTDVFASDALLHLAGTACAFEGNLLIHVLDEEGDWKHFYTQVSIGGPSRGTWSIDVPIRGDTLVVRLGDEDPREGGIAASSLVEIEVTIPQPNRGVTKL